MTTPAQEILDFAQQSGAYFVSIRVTEALIAFPPQSNAMAHTRVRYKFTGDNQVGEENRYGGNTEITGEIVKQIIRGAGDDLEWITVDKGAWAGNVSGAI